MVPIFVGQAVRKENFWDRKDELEDIWDAIESGSHVLLTAPRRVGKTSIMYKILDEPRENYIPIYLDVESADSENEFWQKLFNILIDEDFTSTLQAHSQSLWERLTNIEIRSISLFEGVEFGDGKKFSYKEAFYKLIKDLDSNKKIIIMIDEFAQTIENIIQYESQKNALSLLKTHRELRQNIKISDKVTFIYAGSIGLESIVLKMGATKHINDLNSIKIYPLSFENATIFINHLSQNNKIDMSDEVITYLLKEIEWFIPFYIQLIMQEVKRVNRREPIITNETIDKAINNALDHKQHFQSWESKLKSGLNKNGYSFAKEILTIISKELTLSYLKIINISSKYEWEEDEARETLNSLVYDGYINNNDDAKIYRFNSPILRKWWYKNVN